mmetsp:Transcript_8890/g.13355  ORF Transcript_8890/g.13355 Transcript_8890/m.13355 type:complete len:100 (-) Transcript_8890:2304-2603(-)
MTCLPDFGSGLLIHGLDDKRRVAALESIEMRDTETGRAPRNRPVGEVEMLPVIGSTPVLTDDPSSNPIVKITSSDPPSVVGIYCNATLCGRALRAVELL